MAADLSDHDEIVRSALDRHGGNIFSTGGDAFCAAFPDAASALDAAVEAQRALSGFQWQTSEAGLAVRMAIHTGAAEERRQDYFGPTLNRVARLLSAGHGGQVLISAATWLALPRDHGFDAQDLGDHQLKDLEDREHIFQLVAQGLPSGFPPLRTLSVQPNNLPSSLASFVGRSGELATLARLIQENRLVTVSGPGGAGKTRLSLEAGSRMLGDFADGVWMVELASLNDPSLVAQETLGQLRIRSPHSQSPLAILCESMAAKEALIIVDNCEHVVEEAARMIRRLLEAAPAVRVLATSRVTLGIAGEKAWSIPNMNTSVVSGPSGSDAVRLLLERAPFAHVEGDDLDLADGICRRLDGLPLAIELAAARLRALSLAELDRRLDDRFRLLTSRDPTVSSQHRTLLATVDWSYDLLSEQARRAYRWLSVFGGSFDLASAEFVLDAAAGPDPPTAVDIIDELVSQSLLVPEPGGDTSRYRMLETMQEHGRRRLDENQETASAHQALLAWSTSLVREASPALQGPDQPVWIDRLVGEVDNLRRALAWALDNDPVSGLALTAPLANFWWLHAVDQGGTARFRSTSFLAEGAAWSKRMIAAAGSHAPPKARARAQMALGGLLQVRLGEFDESVHRLTEAIQLFKELGDQRGEGWAEFYYGVAAWGQIPDYEVVRHFERAVEFLGNAGDAAGVALSTLLLASSLWTSGHLDKARPHWDDYMAMAEKYPVPNLVMHAADGRILIAPSYGDEIDPSDVATAFEGFIAMGQFGCLAHTIEAAAVWQASIGQLEDSAVLLGIAQRIRDSLGMVTAPYELRTRHVEEAGLAAFDHSLRVKAFTRGHSMDIDQSVAYLRQLIDLDNRPGAS